MTNAYHIQYNVQIKDVMMLYHAIRYHTILKIISVFKITNYGTNKHNWHFRMRNLTGKVRNSAKMHLKKTFYRLA